MKTVVIGFKAYWDDGGFMSNSVDIHQSEINPVISPVLDACSKLDWMGIKGRRLTMEYSSFGICIIKCDDKKYDGQFIARIATKDHIICDLNNKQDAGMLSMLISIELDKHFKNN